MWSKLGGGEHQIVLILYFLSLAQDIIEKGQLPSNLCRKCCLKL